MSVRAWLILIFLLLSRRGAFGASFERLQAGAYYVHAAGCANCHTAPQGPAFAGGRALVTPFGVFQTPNMTSDVKTGIGGWSEADFVRAMRTGRSPKGEPYYPAFPYRSYMKLKDQDLSDMFEYLRSVPIVEKKSLPHQLRFPYSQRWLLYAWQDAFLAFNGPDPADNIRTGSGAYIGDRKKSDSWNRGAYLVEAVLHCAECHSPRDISQSPVDSMWMARGAYPVGGVYPPNITPDVRTGLGLWSEKDWLRFLSSGFAPNGKQVGGEMALVIQNTANLTAADRRSVVEYMRSLPAVENP